MSKINKSDKSGSAGKSRTNHPKDLRSNPFIPKFSLKNPTPAIRRFFVEREEIWLSFVFAFGAMFCAYMIFGVWPRGERSVLCLDLNAQYVYYHIYMRDALFGPESIFYSWSRNFSGEFVGIIGYYLFSPFNFLVWIMPVEYVTEGLLLMIVTKIGSIGATMAIYLGYWRGFSKHTTVMFSVMYALTSYNIVQTMNPMWLDGVMALPLIVMGIEALLKQGKYRLLVGSLAYAFITNFYIGFMLGIFAAIYFVYYALTSRKWDKANFIVILKRTGLFAAAAGISVMMSAFIILPVYASLSLGKFDFSEPNFASRLSFEMFDLTRKLFMNSYDTVRMEGLPFLFSGTLVMLLLPAYFVCGRIRRARRFGGFMLLLVLTWSMIITPIDMLWHGGQMPNWLPYRYSFILGFLAIAFGAEAFKNIRKISDISLGAITIVFGSLLFYWNMADTFKPNLGRDGRDVFPTNESIYPAVAALIIISLFVICAKNRLRKMNVFSMVLLGIVCVEMTVNAVHGLHGQNTDITYSTRPSWESIVITREVTDELNAGMDERGEFYRMEKNFMRSANDPMALRMRGVTHSSSMLNANALHTMSGFGYAARSHSARYWGATPLTDDLFGFRYTLSAPTRHHSSVESRDDITVTTNHDVLPIAYLVDRQVEHFRLERNDVFGNQNRLLSSMLGDVQANPYFVRMTWEDRRPNENLEHKMIGEYHAYERTRERVNAHIQYDFTAEVAGDVYMYFPTGFERKTNLWLQRYDPRGDEYNPEAHFIGQMYETDHHHIHHVGHFEEGERFMVTVSLAPESTIMYFRDQIFVRLDRERLEADVQRIHDLNANSTFEAVSNRRLRITTNHEEEQLLFTSIPMEPGWRAYVNGQRVPIQGIVNWTASEPADPPGLFGRIKNFFVVFFDIGEKDDKGDRIVEPVEMHDVERSGFMAIAVPAGENEIELRFFPNMMPMGIALSFAGIAAFLLLGAVLHFFKNRPNSKLALAQGKSGDFDKDGGDMTSESGGSSVARILAEIGVDMDADDSGGTSDKSRLRRLLEHDEYEGYDEDYIKDIDDVDLEAKQEL
jgi:uncharacterized membrane protein YfhO